MNITELFKEKCSICFENNMNFSLERCRDQFCFECFYQYILALSQQQQWQYGGCVTRPQVKCPVCSDPLQKHEWSCYLVRHHENYVDLRRLYESTAAERFKSVSRHCPECAGECAIVVNIAGANRHHFDDHQQNRNQLLELLFDKLLLRLKEDDPFLDEYEEFMKSQGLNDSRQDRRRSTESGEADMSVDEDDDTDDDEEEDRHHYNYVSSRNRIPELFDRMKQALEERSCLADVVLRSSTSSSTTSAAIDIVTDTTIANPALLPLPSPADSAIAVSPSSIVQAVKRRRLLHRLQTSEAEKQLYCLATSDYNNYDIGSILKLLVSLETDLTNWYKLVFALLKDYYRVKCEKCDEQFCFRCGLSGWHSGMTCSENMKRLIDERMQTGEPLQGEDEKLGNLKWVYEHGKQCPRCYTVITRDEGCNKVDCTVCSFKFCWICCNEWSDKCGYFKCKTNNAASPQSNLETKDKHPSNSTTDVKDENNPDKPNIDALPEVGVPNVRAIMQRLGPSP